MVARINTGKSVRKALHYNEHKIKEGQAEILCAAGFLKDVNCLSLSDKINSFSKYTSLNEKAVTNTLHVSLNFDPSEKLENQRMIAIASNYMDQIGFGNQPYLVYRHYDSGHPHIHIVSTNIQSDGSRISMHNLGRKQSESARKKIEKDFGLIKAESKKLADAMKIKPINPSKIVGKRTTKSAISNVLGAVISQYKYSSLAELNAVLGLYNVTADRCGLNSPTYKHNGLVFRVLDENGKKIGTPIKASLFYMKPTLSNLETKFIENEELKQDFVKRVRTTIDFTVLKNQGCELNTLIDSLEKERISVILRKNSEGLIYGITYVDHLTKCVFNGSDLGKKFSAKKITEHTDSSTHSNQPIAVLESRSSRQRNDSNDNYSDVLRDGATTGIVESVTTVCHVPDSIPYQLKKNRRCKKRRRIQI